MLFFSLTGARFTRRSSIVIDTWQVAQWHLGAFVHKKTFIDEVAEGRKQVDLGPTS